MTIDLTKTARLVSSRRPVRILCVEPESDYPLIGYYDNDQGHRIHTAWAWDGRNYDMHGAQIENVTERDECWVNIYPAGTPAAHSTRELADKYAGHDRIACVRVEYEEGEGL